MSTTRSEKNEDLTEHFQWWCWNVLYGCLISDSDSDLSLITEGDRTKVIFLLARRIECYWRAPTSNELCTLQPAAITALYRWGVTINRTGPHAGPYRTAVVVLVHVFAVLQYLARVWQH